MCVMSWIHYFYVTWYVFCCVAGYASSERTISARLSSPSIETILWSHQFKQRLVDKYCPFYNIHGVPHCPLFTGMPHQNTTFSSIEVIVTGSGHGFNTHTRQLAFPIYIPMGAISTSGTHNDTFRFSNMDEYMQHAIDPSQSNRMGGVFSESNTWIDALTAAFGDSSETVHLAQKEYYTHESTIVRDDAKAAFTMEFKEALHMLPMEPFDAHNESHVHVYGLFFQLFGTSVIREALHGGIVNRIVAIKTCYGGDVSAEMLAELQNHILKESTGSYAYLRYRQLGLLDVHGGHPEIIEDLQQRIATFAQSPALVRFRIDPLVNIVPQVYRENFRLALQWYHRDMISWKESLKTRVEQAKLERYKTTKQVHVFFITAPMWEISGSVIPQPCGWCRRSQQEAFIPQCVQHVATGVLAPGEAIHLYYPGEPHPPMGSIARNMTDGTFIIQIESYSGSQSGPYIYRVQYDASFTCDIFIPFYELFFALECEPVVVEFDSGSCLPNRRVDCKCAGY